ncbi:MAG: flagellar biosynthesis protein [Rhodobacter sp.]|nr:flagellar biosynthesis protein [Rhodobacter sp.]
MPLTLEDFELLTARTDPSENGMIPVVQAETDRMAAYEQGYQAGWDDAASAQAQDQTRIGAEFARTLQELSFTFHEARAHLIQAMEPLFQELISTLLPELVVETLGLRILEELRPLVEDCVDRPVELVIAPASRPALERQLAAANVTAIRLCEEQSLAEGQAYLRVGKAERQIDMAGALDRITSAVNALYALNEGALQHA